jgi:exopolyphosphatase/guanosine-5'-triphosphate,3'-diphosphate pyrophosphatase
MNSATSPVLAALDLGTNNCRLLLARGKDRSGFRIVDSFSRITRLGEGLAESGRLSDAAMGRTLEALKVCGATLARWHVSRQRFVATAACRQAANGQDFIRRAREETGLEIEIIAADEEARLAAEGCRTLIDKNARFALIFDIGGGSTEITWLEIAKSGKTKESYVSLPVGVVTLAERSQEERAGALAKARDMIEDFERRHGIRRHVETGEAQMLGTSGTVTTLGAVHLGLDRYERRAVDGLVMTKEEIEAVSASLVAMSHEERARHPCIGHQRADLVAMGCNLLEMLREAWPASKLRIADRGLREGLLLGLSSRKAKS